MRKELSILGKENEAGMKKATNDKVLRDADIRDPLFLHLEEQHSKVRFLEEKVIGRARADIVMVLPDKVCGIEIKSDADNYTRLANQVENYDCYFDENYIVAGSTHATHVAEHVPEYWGIISVELIKGYVDFCQIREAKPNPKAKIRNKLRILWKSELAHIQAKAGMPKYANKGKRFIAEKLIECVPEEMLQRQISDELFERDYTIYG